MTGRGRDARPLRALCCMLLAAVAATCVSGGSTAARHAAPAAAQAMEIGANLPGISDWSATPVYVDLVRQARRFGRPDTPWDEAAVLGADGWPTGDFGVFLMTGQAGLSGTAGVYRVGFDGRADVAVVASNARVTGQAYDPGRNRTTLDVVVPEGADQLALKFTRTGPGIKALSIVRPGYPLRDPPLFTTPFLAHLARFRTLRFMDWLATNANSDDVTWAARPTPDGVRYAGKSGVPWEHVVALANATGKDIWINIPVRADDDYVRQLARLLHATLRRDLRIYVEYSNELWNAGFAQFAVNLELARMEVAGDPRSPLVFDRMADRNVIGFRRVAMRLAQISDLFRAEYGDAAMMRIVRPVLAGQVVQPYIAEIGLSFVEAVYGPPAHYFYALAGAPYFNLGPRQTSEGMSVDQVLGAMQDSIGALASVNAFEKNRALASWYGLHWIAYEGGADTFGPGSLPAKRAASVDPRMEALCAAYLRTWSGAGGELMMWYTAGAGRGDSPYGTWELTRDLAVTDAPKLRCLDRAIAGSSAVAKPRRSAPGTFAAGAHVGSAESDRDAPLRHLATGRHVDYLVYAERAGRFGLVLTSEAGAPGNVVAVAVNRVELAEVALTVTGWGRPAAQAPARIALDAGFNTVRLSTRAASTGYALHRIDIR